MIIGAENQWRIGEAANHLERVNENARAVLGSPNAVSDQVHVIKEQLTSLAEIVTNEGLTQPDTVASYES